MLLVLESHSCYQLVFAPLEVWGAGALCQDLQNSEAVFRPDRVWATVVHSPLRSRVRHVHALVLLAETEIDG